MTELLGFLEPWYDGEQVVEDGATFEEEKERQEIYVHHLSAQDDLVTVTVTSSTSTVAPASGTSAAVLVTAYTAPPAPGDPTVDAPAPFDVVAHFLSDQQHFESRPATT